MFARLQLALTLFANKHGIYNGRRSTRIHTALYRWTKGRVGGHLPGFPDVGIALVDHVGAKSGIRRTSPLIFLEDAGRVVVTASKAGQPTNPNWFHNLMANPETTVQVGGEVREVRARLATAEERERLWPQFAAMYPAFEVYARNVRRQIPVVILDRR